MLTFGLLKKKTLLALPMELFSDIDIKQNSYMGIIFHIVIITGFGVTAFGWFLKTVFSKAIHLK